MTIKLTRRRMLSAAVAGTLAPTIVSGAAHAAAHAKTKVKPVVYDRMVGDLRISTLLDGYFDLGQNLITNLDEAAINEGLTDAYLDPTAPVRLPISTHLVHGTDGVTLIDAGAGEAFGPTSGRLAATLEAIGVEADDVTRIVLTHMHPDHIGGLLTPEGMSAFPKASLSVSETELKFWTDDAMANAAPETMQNFFILARAVASAFGERVDAFEGNVDLGGGLSTLALPGHTPGHSGVRISDGDDTLLVWGDSTAVAALQFSHPDSGIAFDADGAQAAQTRRRLLDMVATDKLAVAGSHLPFPGVGHVEARNDEYAWIPEHWKIL